LISVFLNALIAYLIGSVSGSMLMGRLRGVDIRKSGSGNAGGTNAFRTQGLVFALGVVLIDIGKGALAAGLLPMLNLAGEEGAVSTEVQAMVCGFMAVVGHCFPVWYGFRGGKGAATAVGALALIQPIVLVPMFLVWVLTLIATGWVGLSTILASLSLVPAFAAWGNSDQQFWFGILLAAFIIGLHYSNIVRMFNGSENRFEKIRFVNWFGRDGRS